MSIYDYPPLAMPVYKSGFDIQHGRIVGRRRTQLLTHRILSLSLANRILRPRSTE